MSGPGQELQPQPQEQAAPALNVARRKQEETDKILQELVGGELPGQGYLYASDPAKRVGQLVETTPEFVRKSLLRAIEVLAFDLQLPYSESKKADVGHAMLAAAQSYLLLDPTVDENGIPVEGEGSQAHATAKAAHEFPPRVQPNAAENAIAAKHEPQEKALRGTRGQTPRPKPRIGS